MYMFILTAKKPNVSAGQTESIGSLLQVYFHWNTNLFPKDSNSDKHLKCSKFL